MSTSSLPEQTSSPQQPTTASSVRKYWLICILLVVITAVEYFIFKIESIREDPLIMYPVLGVLSLIKLFYVVRSYMHLSHEPPVLKLIFYAVVPFSVLIFLILYLVSPMG